MYNRLIITSIRDRALIYSRCILEENMSVRDVAKAYRVGKSSVHSTIQNYLSKVDPAAYQKVRTVLKAHKDLYFK